MIQGRTAVKALRYFTGLVIVVGIAGMCYGVLNRFTIPLFMFDVPTWIIGASAAYMGVKYYRKLPELERKVDLNGGFSWGKFSNSSAKASSRRA